MPACDPLETDVEGDYVQYDGTYDPTGYSLHQAYALVLEGTVEFAINTCSGTTATGEDCAAVELETCGVFIAESCYSSVPMSARLTCTDAPCRAYLSTCTSLSCIEDSCYEELVTNAVTEDDDTPGGGGDDEEEGDPVDIVPIIGAILGAAVVFAILYQLNIWRQNRARRAGKAGPSLRDTAEARARMDMEMAGGPGPSLRDAAEQAARTPAPPSYATPAAAPAPVPVAQAIPIAESIPMGQAVAQESIPVAQPL